MAAEKREVVLVRLAPSLKQALVLIAKQHDRSANQEMIHLLRAHVERNEAPH